MPEIPCNSQNIVGRLPKRSDFLRVGSYSEKHDSKWITPSLIILSAPSPTPANSVRIGLTVSKKIGTAVIRNLIKRRLREIYRSLEATKLFQEGFDYVFIARTEIDKKEFSELKTETLKALAKLQTKLNPPHEKN
jgi:ribonuclease P protein component